MARDDAELVKREFALAAELLRFACRTAAARIDAGRVTLADLPEAQRAEFAAELADLLPRYRQLWLARNRSGGLVDSAGRLEKLLDELR
jgi:FPC/CPF motif-containing protein YcgG